MEAGRKNVKIGPLLLGPAHPVMLQSMCNVATLETHRLVEQCKRIFDAGASLVRITTRNLEEARSLRSIRSLLNEQGYPGPLCADVHFSPPAAFEAARWVEKVRINPGNFSKDDPAPPLKQLLELCRNNNTALRIGINHGSLSARIMEQYGDTPEGMVASAMEYLEICQENKFDSLVVSLKSSNTRVMVFANRMMKRRMEESGMRYPLHLGVTEAGEGMEGRIRSAVGIGTLLSEGLGDTIRVSLTEDPEIEIPVARKLVDCTPGMDRTSGARVEMKQPKPMGAINRESYHRRASHLQLNMGGTRVPVVIGQALPVAGQTTLMAGQTTDNLLPPEPQDYLFVPDHRLMEDPPPGRLIINAETWIRDQYPEDKYFPMFALADFLAWDNHSSRLNFILVSSGESAQAMKVLPAIDRPYALVFLHDRANGTREAFESWPDLTGCDHPY